MALVRPQRERSGKERTRGGKRERGARIGDETGNCLDATASRQEPRGERENCVCVCVCVRGTCGFRRVERSMDQRERGRERERNRSTHAGPLSSVVPFASHHHTHTPARPLFLVSKRSLTRCCLLLPLSSPARFFGASFPSCARSRPSPVPLSLSLSPSHAS